MTNKKLKEELNKPLLLTGFILFIIILIWAVFFKGIGLFSNRDNIYRLFYGEYASIIENILDRFLDQFASRNLLSFKTHILNIIMFIPFGIFLPILNNKSFKHNLLISFFISLFIEVYELIFAVGGFEFLDLLTNCLGYSLGYLLYKYLVKKLPNNIVNYALIIIIILVIPLAIYGYINVFKNFDIFKCSYCKYNFINLFKF